MTTLKTWTTRFALPALLCVAAASAQAVPVLSNLPGVDSGAGTNLGLGVDGADRTKGVGMTMGASSLTFQSMSALIANITNASTLSGGIFSSVGGNPGVQLAAFTPQAIAATFPASVVTLTTASSFVLQANTAYWFVLDGPTTENSLSWNSLAPNVAPSASGGVTYNGYRFSSDGGTTWGVSGVSNGVTISVVPETSTVLMLALGLGVIGLQLRRR
ncbi:MAG: choice-of-anchor R domain-containing protein [Rubrivivax sp.]